MKTFKKLYKILRNIIVNIMHCISPVKNKKQNKNKEHENCTVILRLVGLFLRISYIILTPQLPFVPWSFIIGHLSLSKMPWGPILLEPDHTSLHTHTNTQARTYIRVCARALVRARVCVCLFIGIK